jgi:mono/diheme cytochrome c family protein
MRIKGTFAGKVLIACGGLGAAVLVGCATLSGGTGKEPSTAAKTGAATHVDAASPQAAGEYLVRIGGCNDCHTPGYSLAGGHIPRALWLTGVPVGFRGPWGTTYASNLRLYVDPISEDDWVRVIRARKDKPPMPWTSLHAMSDPDLRAIYRYIKSLGKAGSPTPEDVPPGQTPKTPYIVFAPPTFPAGSQAAAPAGEDKHGG